MAVPRGTDAPVPSATTAGHQSPQHDASPEVQPLASAEADSMPDGENFQMQNQHDHELAGVSSLTVNSGTASVETEFFGSFGVFEARRGPPPSIADGAAGRGAGQAADADGGEEGMSPLLHHEPSPPPSAFSCPPSALSPHHPSALSSPPGADNAGGAAGHNANKAGGAGQASDGQATEAADGGEEGMSPLLHHQPSPPPSAISSPPSALSLHHPSALSSPQ